MALTTPPSARWQSFSAGKSPAPNLAVLERLRARVLGPIAPLAHRLDGESEKLFEAFQALGEQGLLAPKVPTDFGGLGFDTLEFQQFQSEIARCSGALAFLQTQHQSAASFLLASTNEDLRQAYLPAMATGQKRVGVGFSQLRRQPAPCTAQPVAGGYRLSGEVPWVTGAGLFEEFVGDMASMSIGWLTAIRPRLAD